MRYYEPEQTHHKSLTMVPQQRFCVFGILSYPEIIPFHPFPAKSFSPWACSVPLLHQHCGASAHLPGVSCCCDFSQVVLSPLRWHSVDLVGCGIPRRGGPSSNMMLKNMIINFYKEINSACSKSKHNNVHWLEPNFQAIFYRAHVSLMGMMKTSKSEQVVSMVSIRCKDDDSCNLTRSDYQVHLCSAAFGSQA